MSAKPTRIAIGALVRQGTTPDERAQIASEEWSRAKQAVHFTASGADREQADADRVTALRLYREARREARQSSHRASPPLAR